MRSSSSESDRTYDNSWSENSSDNRRFSSSAARRRSCSERIRRWRRRHSNAATPTTRRATAALRTGCSRHMFIVFYILQSFLRINLEPAIARSEEHTSELQSLAYLVCRLLLEKKNDSRDPPSPSATSSRNVFAPTSTTATRTHR